MGNRDIIVIGGSAGATAPLKEILARLPSDLPAAVFVVLHIPAQGIGILSTVASAVGRARGESNALSRARQFGAAEQGEPDGEFRHHGLTMLSHDRDDNCA